MVCNECCSPVTLSRSPLFRYRESMARKSVPKAHQARKVARKKSAPARRKTVLLSGGNPQIEKGYGDAPVKKYLAAMPGWKREIGRRIDAIVERVVPDVYKAVKWNSPFYGFEGKGWFASMHCYTNYVQVTFFRGTSLDPVPAGESKHPRVRYYNVRENELDEAQFAEWVKQASRLPGEKL
jgi:hypothetical protein